LQIDRELVEDVVVVAPTGHLDSKSSPELEALVMEDLGRGHRRYVIDFRGVETISSAALRVLLMFTRKLRPAGGDLALSSLNTHVRQVFEISGFTGSFRICESRGAALEQLGPAENRSERTARLAARALGIATPSAAMGTPDGTDIAEKIGGLALRALTRTDAAVPGRAADSGSETAGIVGSSSDDPGIDLDNGRGSAAAPTPWSHLWRRLRRRMGVDDR
jgi:anti-anti-sigma factor